MRARRPRLPRAPRPQRAARPRRARARRVVFVIPSLFTLANLFFGIWSIVLASSGEFYRASWYIVIAGLLDTLDGRVARISGAGSQFGAQLDSLVDLVSFGVAPGALVYFLVFAGPGDFSWVFSYGFIVCVALRLARYNVGDTGHDPGGAFQGMPSPAAGMTLATYYPFSQTAFYQSQLAGLPWSQLLIFLTIALGLAMVSTVRYARLPRVGVRSAHGLVGLAVNITILAFGIWERDVFFFPLGIAYLTYGMARGVVVGFLERGDEEVLVPSGEDVGAPVSRLDRRA